MNNREKKQGSGQVKAAVCAEKRMAWQKPLIMSSEPLEAAAANCNGTSGYGKSVAAGCSANHLLS
jgi:hypothetical protein